jgi:hypothetical protein
MIAAIDDQCAAFGVESIYRVLPIAPSTIAPMRQSAPIRASCPTTRGAMPR